MTDPPDDSVVAAAPPRRLRQSERVLAETMGERVILLDAEGREVITLNPVGSVVWAFLADERDLDDVVDHLAARFPEVARDRLVTDVEAFVDELEAASLITSGAG